MRRPRHERYPYQKHRPRLHRLQISPWHHQTRPNAKRSDPHQDRKLYPQEIIARHIQTSRTTEREGVDGVVKVGLFIHYLFSAYA